MNYTCIQAILNFFTCIIYSTEGGEVCGIRYENPTSHMYMCTSRTCHSISDLWYARADQKHIYTIQYYFANRVSTCYSITVLYAQYSIGAVLIHPRKNITNKIIVTCTVIYYCLSCTMYVPIAVLILELVYLKTLPLLDTHTNLRFLPLQCRKVNLHIF